MPLHNNSFSGNVAQRYFEDIYMYYELKIKSPIMAHSDLEIVIWTNLNLNHAFKL